MKPLLSLTALVFIVSLAGCGGGGSSGSSTPAAPATTTPTSTPTTTPTSTPTSTPTTTPTSTPTSLPSAPPVADSAAAPTNLTDDDNVDNTIGTPANNNTAAKVQPGTGAPGQPNANTIDGIPCVVDPNDSLALTFHHHAHISLFVNGAQIAVPGAIGIFGVVSHINPFFFETDSSNPKACFYNLHTHTPSGVIHMEVRQAGDSTTFTLKQFLDIWGVNVTATGISSTVNSFFNFTGATRVFSTSMTTGTAGTHPVVEVTGKDLNTVPLSPNTEYTIEVGATVSIPNYTFDPNFLSAQSHRSL